MLRRIARLLGLCCVLLSAILTALAGIGWYRSEYLYERVQCWWPTRFANATLVHPFDRGTMDWWQAYHVYGRLTLSYGRDFPILNSDAVTKLNWQLDRNYASATYDTIPTTFATSPVQWRLFGLGFYELGTGTQPWRSVQIHYWLILPIVALPLARWMLIAVVRTPLRRRRGCCPSCAYDLRGVPNPPAGGKLRCPECGSWTRPHPRRPGPDAPPRNPILTSRRIRAFAFYLLPPLLVGGAWSLSYTHFDQVRCTSARTTTRTDRAPGADSDSRMFHFYVCAGEELDIEQARGILRFTRYKYEMRSASSIAFAQIPDHDSIWSAEHSPIRLAQRTTRGPVETARTYNWRICGVSAFDFHDAVNLLDDDRDDFWNRDAVAAGVYATRQDGQGVEVAHRTVMLLAIAPLSIALLLRLHRRIRTGRDRAAPPQVATADASRIGPRTGI